MKTKPINLKITKAKEREGNQKLLTQKRNKTNKVANENHHVIYLKM